MILKILKLKVSVGDSLLNFYSEEKIKNSELLHYHSRKFYQIALLIESGKYDALNINLKEGDKYVVHSIKGLKDYDNKHKDCLKEKNIISEISNCEKY